MQKDQVESAKGRENESKNKETLKSEKGTQKESKSKRDEKRAICPNSQLPIQETPKRKNVPIQIKRSNRE